MVMSDASAETLQQSLDRGVQVMAALEATARKHERLVTFQNAIMIVLLLAMLALASVLAIYTGALIVRY